jgi:single-stranded-DNA-specific exonuclease
MDFLWVPQPNSTCNNITDLAKELNISPILAQILLRRGVDSYQLAQRFFRPQLDHVHNPFLFREMNAAVEVLNEALRANKRIRLYGDYDVDGTTAVAIFMNVLFDKAGSLDYYIPDRYREGYGLSQQGVQSAIDDGVDLFITLDCGIRSVALIQQLRDHHIQVIVCDHHEPGNTLPPAVILDPKTEGESYPFKGLSGAGVGMKLLEALYQNNSWPKEELHAQLDLLALSIAADIVPVTDENRVYAYYGLKHLNASPRPAFRKMLNSANRSGEVKLSDLVFGIAPRINAAGRIRSGSTAVACMLHPVQEDLDRLIQEIEADNLTRKGLDQQITHEALALLEMEPPSRSVNILYAPGWHKGVVGIVASRIIEKYPLPTIVLTEIEGVLSGSARTIGEFDIHDALTQCASLLSQFGGHQHAAGLTLPLENFQAFKAKMDALAAAYFDTHSRIPELKFDAELSLKDIFENESTQRIPKLLRILAQFEPFGPGNPRPVFVSRAVKANQYSLLKGAHLKLALTDVTLSSPVSGIVFNALGKESIVQQDSFDVAYSLEVNEFNHQRSLQLAIKDILPKTQP